ncbi:ogr/Delta-like zinc finger family protein [Variovorax sp. M-6]|uniref:ogr/Delta-like zinc finger family protein n=1 Tax=Variovorax sp. M-6 TaxID=3233041 RepID=UPI003F9CC06D
MKMRCPHCKSTAHVRSSYEVSDLSRETYFACSNTACGHTFAAVTEIHRTLSPSAIPDPKIRLPLSKHVRRKVLVEQLMTLPTSPMPPPA